MNRLFDTYLGNITGLGVLSHGQAIGRIVDYFLRIDDKSYCLDSFLSNLNLTIYLKSKVRTSSVEFSLRLVPEK